MKTNLNNSLRRLLSIACLSTLFALTACEQKGPAEKAGQKIDQATTKAGKELESARSTVEHDATAAGQYMDDALITAKVKEAIVADDLLKASQIEVTSVNGVVKLNGTLDSEQLIDRANKLVSGQKYVKSVQNELKLSVSEMTK